MDAHVLPSLQRLIEALDEAAGVTQQIKQLLQQAEAEAAKILDKEPGEAIDVQNALGPGFLPEALASGKGMAGLTDVALGAGPGPKPDDYRNERKRPRRGLGPNEQFLRGTLFPTNGEIRPEHIAQGDVGDCYYLAALGAIALQRPDLIKKMIKQNQDGTFTVTFGDGTKQTVESVFPMDANGAPKFARPVAKDPVTGSPILWPLIFERALAQRYGGYDNINGPGNPGRWMSDITGLSGIFTPGAATNFESMYDTLARGGAAIFVTQPSLVSGPVGKTVDGEDIFWGHAYVVKSIDPIRQKITLMNPHGQMATPFVLELSWTEAQSYVGWSHTNPVSSQSRPMTTRPAEPS
jgi:hypothetical protein